MLPTRMRRERGGAGRKGLGTRLSAPGMFHLWSIIMYTLGVNCTLRTRPLRGSSVRCTNEYLTPISLRMRVGNIKKGSGAETRYIHGMCMCVWVCVGG